MSLEPAQFVAILRGLVDEDPHVRWESAGSVTDVRTELDRGETHGLAYMLAVLATWEPDGMAREAQLHALAELHEWGAITEEAIDVVRRIDRATLVGSEIEHVEWLTGG